MIMKDVKAETPYGIKTVKLTFSDAAASAVDEVFKSSAWSCNDVVTRPGVDHLRMMGVDVRYADSY